MSQKISNTLAALAARMDEAKGGKKFKALVKALDQRSDVEDPKALAAWIGRKKYGAKKFAKMAAAGRKESVEVSEASAGMTTPLKAGTVVNFTYIPFEGKTYYAQTAWDGQYWANTVHEVKGKKPALSEPYQTSEKPLYLDRTDSLGDATEVLFKIAGGKGLKNIVQPPMRDD